MIMSLVEMQYEMRVCGVTRIDLRRVCERWEVRLEWSQQRPASGVGETPAEALNLAFDRAHRRLSFLQGGSG